MPGWARYPIKDSLGQRWGCPVSLDNDAELGALSEWAAGAGRGESNLIFIKVGARISVGLFLEGQLYRGAAGSAGEIGHLIVEGNGPVCFCAHLGRMAFVLKEDETRDPVHVSLLGAVGIVFGAYSVAHLIEEFLSLRRDGRRVCLHIVPFIEDCYTVSILSEYLFHPV